MIPETARNQIQPQMDKEVIEKNFQRIRRKKGLTWAQIATRAGVKNYQTITNLLQRNNSITISTLERLANILEVDFRNLLEDETNTTPDQDQRQQQKTKPKKEVKTKLCCICPNCRKEITIQVNAETLIQDSNQATRTSNQAGKQ